MEPLASQLRPKSLEGFVGQKHLVGPGKPLRMAIEQGHIFSFILWGPPGVGKTTLAKIYAASLKARFFELSAVSAGKDDIKRIVEEGGGQASLLAGPKILFLDEIHRFNKAQQDFLLPYVEHGDLVLIGATTENPSFEVIPALLSRCRVFVLHELTEDEMREIVRRTGVPIEPDAEDWLVRIANGDARQAIGVIENASKLYLDGTKKGATLTVAALTDTVQNRFLRFDKKGDEHYDTVSAFIKSMRASQPDAALYYLARMIEGGEDPKFIARRMVVFASEDVGMAQPTALVVAHNVFRAVETIGLPEAAINLAHGVVYLATAPKDRAAYDAYLAAMADAKEFGNLSVPLKIRNAPTKLMKELGYHAGYEFYGKDDLLPERLQGKKYYNPKKK